MGPEHLGNQNEVNLRKWLFKSFSLFHQELILRNVKVFDIFFTSICSLFLSKFNCFSPPKNMNFFYLVKNLLQKKGYSAPKELDYAFEELSKLQKSIRNREILYGHVEKIFENFNDTKTIFFGEDIKEFSSSDFEEILKNFAELFEQLEDWKTVCSFLRVNNCFECEDVLEEINETLQKKDDTTIPKLKSFIEKIEKSASSLEKGYKEFLVFFVKKGGALFTSYLKQFLLEQLKIAQKKRYVNDDNDIDDEEETKEEIHIEEELKKYEKETLTLSEINSILNKTRKALLDILTSKDLQLCEIDKAVKFMKSSLTVELQSIGGYPYFRERVGERFRVRLEELEKCFRLSAFIESIPKIIEVVERYKMYSDQKDHIYLYLKEKKSFFEKRKSKISLSESIELLEDLCKVIDLNEQQIHLFKNLGNYYPVITFLIENKYCSQREFEHFMQLAGQNIQAENKFESKLLDDLSVSYLLLDKFLSAMENRYGLKVLFEQFPQVQGNDLTNLNNVKKNLDLIKEWDDQIKGNVYENATKICNSLIDSGRYFVRLKSGVNKKNLQIKHPFLDTKNSITFLLEYQFDFTERIDDQEIKKKKDQILYPEKVEDFVCRWTIFSDLEENSSVCKFISIHKVMMKIIDLFVEMQNLGHPAFQDSVKSFEIKENILEELNDYRIVFEQRIEEWKTHHQLQMRKGLLLFFNTKQILSLQEAISSKNSQVYYPFFRVLFRNRIPPLKVIEECIEKSPVSNPFEEKEFYSDFEDLKRSDSEERAIESMQQLSKLIDLVKDKVNQIEKIDPFIFGPENDEALVKIYFAFNFNSQEIFQLLISIYKERKPFPKELFLCSSNTSIDELEQQMELIKVVKNGNFSFLFVENLPHKLRFLFFFFIFFI